ncbi:MAG: hypothetical protein KDA98_03770, partial [Acidimicrobiales bacterium]|nr:hypothetical protein [Acidimicrobiales bacterium]
MNDHPADLPALAPVRRYADGATVLVRRPQAGATWTEVREGWWWHLAGMVLVPVAYPVAALTVWQQPSRQPLARRLAWATLLTLGAYLLVGLPAFVVFSQRWYALHRSATTPEDAGLADVDPAAASGYYGTVATVGRRIVDAVTGVLPGADVPVAVPMLAEPWGSLRDEAATAARRLDRLDVVALGPAGPAVARARGEAVAAFGSVARTAAQGAAVDQVLTGMDTEALERRLVELEGRRGSADDLAAAHRSLRDQLAIAERL